MENPTGETTKGAGGVSQPDSPGTTDETVNMLTQPIAGDQIPQALSMGDGHLRWSDRRFWRGCTNDTLRDASDPSNRRDRRTSGTARGEATGSRVASRVGGGGGGGSPNDVNAA